MRKAIQDFKTHQDYITYDNEINIRIAGRGGQGIIKAGLILSEAFVMEGRNVAQIQSYGPEARGGACRTDIVVSDTEIDYPGLRRLDYFIVLDETAYKKYQYLIDDRTTVIYDSSTFKAEGIGMPFSKISKREFGSDLFVNMIAIGMFSSITGIIDPKKVTAIIRKRMKRSEDNIRAFMIGYEIGGKELVITK